MSELPLFYLQSHGQLMEFARGENHSSLPVTISVLACFDRPLLLLPLNHPTTSLSPYYTIFWLSHVSRRFH